MALALYQDASQLVISIFLVDKLRCSSKVASLETRTTAMTLIDQLRTARVMLANYADHDELQGHVEDAEYTRRVIEDIDMTLSAPLAPPVTNHQYAAALTRTAAARCLGCRTAWRLNGWMHSNRMECRAKSERQALRDIATNYRAAEVRS